MLITGTDPNVALSLGGASTSRPIRVEVKHSDFERADTLLKQDHLRAKRVDSWICRRCHEQNEPTFDVCWSCNKIHEESDARGQGNSCPDNRETVSNSPTEVTEQVHECQLGAVNKRKHKQEARSHKKRHQYPTDQVQEDLTESVSRCARSAVVGLLLFPPFLSMYSIYLLLNLDPLVYRNADTQRRVWSIWILNTAVVSLGTTLWWLLIFRE